MSNYTKTTNFAVKDGYSTGNPSKVVKGTEIDDEFNAIASAISSKADTASPTFTGTPAAPTAVVNTNSTQIATTAFVVAEIADGVSDERTATATLTNKTLTSPTINGGTISGITDLAIADGGTGASTASAAFTNLKQPASDTATGVVELATVAEVRTGTDTTRAITPEGFNGASLGWGQTWQDVTASRALSTTYTNSTGKPIMIAVNGSQTPGSAQMVVTIAGLAMTVAYSGSGYSNASGQFIVPNGATYAVSGINNLQYWYELR